VFRPTPPITQVIAVVAQGETPLTQTLGSSWIQLSSPAFLSMKRHPNSKPPFLEASWHIDIPICLCEFDTSLERFIPLLWSEACVDVGIINPRFRCPSFPALRRTLSFKTAPMFLIVVLCSDKCPPSLRMPRRLSCLSVNYRSPDATHQSQLQAEVPMMEQFLCKGC
jgi:hypothetical protein